MNTFKKFLILSIIVFMSANSMAQDRGEDDFGLWFMYFGTNKVADRFGVLTEAQFRYYETIDNFNQLLLRTGLEYKINEEAFALLGYGYIDTDPSFGDGVVNTIIEHRIFEQLILKGSLWKFKLRHRYRLEQRFIDNKDLNDSRFDWRARYHFQVTLPLDEKWFLNFYDEIFINLQDDLFGQNRLFAAVGLKIKNGNIQVGYLRNQFSSAVFNRYQLALTYNPDLRGLFKKKQPDDQ